VCDTNILFSAVLFPKSKLSKCLESIVGQYRIILPSQVIEELLEVVSRKFPQKIADCKHFLNQLDYEPHQTPEQFSKKDFPEIRDEKDLPILVSAIQSGADFFITGDQDFHALPIEKPTIITITDFCARFL